MKKELKVSKEWYNWFCNEAIEVVSIIDNREMYTESIKGEFKGNQINYQIVFKLLDTFIMTFNFLLVEKIRLTWSDGLKKMQFYYEGQDYEHWKESVIKEGFEIDWLSFFDYEDSTDLFYNYSLNVEGEKLNLYKQNQTDRTAFYLWYNSKTNTTHYKIEIELRKSLFKLDDNFKINLSDCYTEQNMKVLAESKSYFLNELEALT